MSGTIRIREGQTHIYKLEIIQVFKPQTREERMGGVERVRLDEPTIVKVGWYDTPTAARNHGSYASRRAGWYNSMPHDKYEYVHVHEETGAVLRGETYYRLPDDERYDYKYERREIPPPVEPDRDYRVYRVPITLDMGEATLLPALKKFYKIEE